jgi:hypothetical protein
VLTQHEFTTLMRWVRTAPGYGENWQRSSMRAGAIAWLTADEMAGLRDQIEELMLAYRDRVTDPAKRPEGSRLVRLFSAAYPLPEDGRGTSE